jgi:hypothetical protein
MHNRSRLRALASVLSLALLLQGCATLVGSVPFKYVPSLAGGEPLTLRLGMEKLVDKRPDGDRSATESITDVDEKVTAKLLEDFRSSQMFAAVDFPLQGDKDDLVLKGEITRFYWKLTPSPIVYLHSLQSQSRRGGIRIGRCLQGCRQADQGCHPSGWQGGPPRHAQLT